MRIFDREGVLSSFRAECVWGVVIGDWVGGIGGAVDGGNGYEVSRVVELLDCS